MFFYAVLQLDVAGVRDVDAMKTRHFRRSEKGSASNQGIGSAHLAYEEKPEHMGLVSAGKTLLRGGDMIDVYPIMAGVEKVERGVFSMFQQSEKGCY